MPNDRDLRRYLLGRWTRRGSLFVPPTLPARHGEMDNIKAYVSFSELEILETILPQGVSLLEVIEARARDPKRRNIGLKNFLITKYAGGTNAVLLREYKEIGAHAKRLLFGGNA